MTESQRKQLSQIIDLNWDISQETNPGKKYQMVNELIQKKKALRDDMGHEEYDKFIENGRKMFAPKS